MHPTGRQPLADAPANLRARLLDEIGGDLLHEYVPAGGYTASVASIVTTPTGRWFVKAAPEGGYAARGIHEAVAVARHTAALGPRLVASVTADGWVGAAWVAVDGEAVHRWVPEQLDRLQQTVAEMYRTLASARPAGWQALRDHTAGAFDLFARLHRGDVPDHIPIGALPDSDTMARLAGIESRWQHESGHDALLHFDRGDNIIDDHNRLWVIDWSCRLVGPGWMDLVLLCADLAANGIDPEGVLHDSLWRDADRDTVSGFIAAAHGYWLDNSHQSEPANVTGLRTLQRRRAQVTWDSLRSRGALG